MSEQVPNSMQGRMRAKTPTNRDLTRFVERSRAQKLGLELPLTTEEAARYVGLHRKTVERMARAGEIPAHPASSLHNWMFYASELDSWLQDKVGR